MNIRDMECDAVEAITKSILVHTSAVFCEKSMIDAHCKDWQL